MCPGLDAQRMHCPVVQLHCLLVQLHSFWCTGFDVPHPRYIRRFCGAPKSGVPHQSRRTCLMQGARSVSPVALLGVGTGFWYVRPSSAPPDAPALAHSTHLLTGAAFASWMALQCGSFLVTFASSAAVARNSCVRLWEALRGFGSFGIIWEALGGLGRMIRKHFEGVGSILKDLGAF